MDVLVRNPCHLLRRGVITTGKVVKDKPDKGTLIALPTVGHRSHIRAVGLKNDARQRHGRGKVFTEMAALEC